MYKVFFNVNEFPLLCQFEKPCSKVNDLFDSYCKIIIIIYPIDYNATNEWVSKLEVGIITTFKIIEGRKVEIFYSFLQMITLWYYLVCICGVITNFFECNKCVITYMYY